MHQWHSFGTSSCERCGLVRMKRSGGMQYSENGTRGPWSRTDAGCDPSKYETRQGTVRVMTDEQKEFEQAQRTVDRSIGWRSRTIVMLDVETTGLDWTIDDVVEVGCAVGRLEPADDGFYKVAIESTYQSLVRPPKFYTRCELADAERDEGFALVEEITGITRRELNDAPLPGEVARELRKAIELAGSDAVLATYNVPFDLPFLAGSLFRAAHTTRPQILNAQGPHLDPFVWVQKFDKWVKGKGRHKLMATAERHGVLSENEASRAHRADFDAMVALRVLAALADRVPDDLEDLLDWQRAARAEWEKEFFGSYRPRIRAEERTRANM